MRYVQSNEKGIATLIALIMVGMLTLIGIAVMSTSDDEVTITGNGLQETRAFYAAEAALESAAAKLHYLSDSAGGLTTIMPSGYGQINESNFTFETADLGPVEQRILDNGTLAGLHARVKSYEMKATAVNEVDGSTVQLSQTFERALVPLFQFAVFYGNDLEIAPGPDMTLIGRVHSNGNLWLQANSSLNIDSYITASGNILHGRKGPGGVSSGDVNIKDGSGNYISMKEGGTDWLDADDGHWYDSSIAKWNGRVQDSTHGQGPLELPLNSTDDPHKLIERADGGNTDSYEELATLKFIDGEAFELVGSTWNNVTADMNSKGIIRLDTFHDAREGEDVISTELDIEKMYDEGYAPSNGVIYFADDNGGSGYPALRISNGEELDDGLTIASENPVYTKGDFNSVNKKPASIMGDAVTFLSDNFDDALSWGSKSARVATATTVNASFLTGNTETTSTNYNGGLENLPRFLEVWSGKSFTWRGSMVNLWNSVQANGDWSGTYYSPPIRDWAYDTDLDDPNNLPPESPVVRVFQRTGWKESDIGYTNLDYSDLAVD
ncbi:MAG: hypothetical protein DWP97_06505 [Calditrichaeota bacterium]|nr:MAG: hypothetical protein DWP97_06505 [Calditrichota bacterium]